MRTYKTVRSLLANKSRWGKGSYYHAGRFCLLGAVGQVVHEGETSQADTGDSQVQRIADAIRQLFPKREGVRESIAMGRSTLGLITRFNDAKSTTHADVLRVVKTAKV